MQTPTRFLLLLFCLLSLVFIPQSRAGAKNPGLTVSTPDQIGDEFKAVPCDNKERLAAIQSLFERSGALATDIRIDKYQDVENVVISKQGTSPQKIIIGAHYDKVADGCGALDNWTGVVTLAHLYRTLKDIQLKKTLVFVAFGKEEKGMLGSRAMTKAIKKEQAGEYCAMINIDSLGLAAPQVADNMSSKKLGEFAADVAKQMKMPFAHASIGAADSDSTSFVEKKIAAVTIHGMTNEWPTILHSRNDQASKVNPTSVYLGYRLVLGMVITMDDSSCGAFS